VSVAGVPGEMDEGDMEGVSCESEEETWSETAPEKPRIDARLIVEVPELPAITVSGSGLADRVKSGPITRMSTNAE
jgi:hypothetical protein